MKDKIMARIYCDKNSHGTLDFFLTVKHGNYYLFTTSYYSHNVYEEYRTGKMVSEIYRNTRCIRQQKLKERIIRMAKYTASENDLDIFGHTTKLTRTSTYTIDAYSEKML